MKIKSVLFFTYLLLALTTVRGQSSAPLTSPDGETKFNLSIDREGALHYQVDYKQLEVVSNGRMGLSGFSSGLELQSSRSLNNDSWWTPVYGERSRIRDHYNSRIYIFENKKKHSQKMQLEVRAYDAGIAFRYSFPVAGLSQSKIHIAMDYTTYAFPPKTMGWFTDHAQGAYQLLPLKNWPASAERPLTLELHNGLFVSLAEAQVVNYCRTKFVLDKDQANTIACSMYEPVDLPSPVATPWHVIMLADNPSQLLQNNDLILNLNPPNAIKDTHWIKPGKIMREVSLSTKGAMELVDFAVKRHLQYIHFDAGWYGAENDSTSDATRVQVDPKRNPVSDLDLQKVIHYAKSKGIGVFLYVNQIALARQLDQVLPLYEKWGVAGIKFGFVEVGSFKWTSWLHNAVKKCAEHHLMVDIHDEYRPTGFSRTYPNLLTQEGVRGNEEMPEANNNTVLPFTRFLCGPADYTICYYHRPELKPELSKSMNTRVLKTTAGHQMALSVIYYSPLQFLYWYDSPKDAHNEPELAFFDSLPTVWDDTQVLDGEIGQYVAIARKRHSDWFLGVITNNAARRVAIPFSFLPSNQQFMATIYADDPQAAIRTKVSIKKRVVDATTVLNAELAPSGGQAIFIQPLNK